MTLFNILVLAVVQGVCELLPVSSSAHVILAEKLMGLDPTTPDMTLLLVMLHIGTMLAVIVYFWRAWRERYFASSRLFWQFAARVTVPRSSIGNMPASRSSLSTATTGSINAGWKSARATGLCQFLSRRSNVWHWRHSVMVVRFSHVKCDSCFAFVGV